MPEIKSFYPKMSDNYNNIQWFHNLPIDQLKLINTKVGLEAPAGAEPIDLQLLYPTLSKYQLKNALEIGGGYGRVVDGLLRNNATETIYTIEPASTYRQFLFEKYITQDKVTTEHTDVFAFACLPVFDVNLLMGASLTQFTPEEQLLVFIKVKSLLKTDGVFIVDTRVAQPDENKVSDLLDGYAYYIPTHEQIMGYATATGMELIEQSNYETSGITRAQYTFQKQ